MFSQNETMMLEACGYQDASVAGHSRCDIDAVHRKAQKKQCCYAEVFSLQREAMVIPRPRGNYVDSLCAHRAIEQESGLGTLIERMIRFMLSSIGSCLYLRGRRTAFPVGGSHTSPHREGHGRKIRCGVQHFQRRQPLTEVTGDGNLVCLCTQHIANRSVGTSLPTATQSRMAVRKSYKHHSRSSAKRMSIEDGTDTEMYAE
ncbi:hypothetical protein F4782DRAFT_36897 [Xylaria castorea]|nr:hypothetical protein F4782DRAFT_36897 [Xylaria castorea]